MPKTLEDAVYSANCPQRVVTATALSLSRRNQFNASLTSAFIDENARRHIVKSFALSDARPDDALNVYVRLAAAMCETPIAALSIVEGDTLRFRARYGLEVQHATAQSSFCAVAIANPQEALVVRDALHDPRFRDSALVTGDFALSFLRGCAAHEQRECRNRHALRRRA